MKTLLKLSIVSCLLTFTTLAQALSPIEIKPIPIGGFPMDITAEDLREVISETANETLNPDGSETKNNCRKDSHCKVTVYSNNCIAINHSTYRARGAEGAMESLMNLHDLAMASDAVCGRFVTEGFCEDKRCEFRETGELAL